MPKRRVRWEPNASACILPSDGLPLSIVIPTVGGASQRRRNLARLLHTLLASPLLRHPSSEVVINHGNQASWLDRAALTEQVAQCGTTCASGGPVVAGAVVNTSKLTHLDGPRAELFAASRFFAAAASRNEIVVSMDDDVMPFGSQLGLLGALVCSVHTELRTKGAPPGLHGSQVRHCGSGGYGLPQAQEDLGDLFDSSVVHRRARRPTRAELRQAAAAAYAAAAAAATTATATVTAKATLPDDRVVLTNFAATTRTLMRRVTAIFDETYTDAVLALRGDGEDATFADAVRRLGGRFVAVDGHVRTLEAKSGTSYSREVSHYPRRKVLCCCLGLGFRGDALRRCIFDGAAANASQAACLCSRFLFGHHNAGAQRRARKSECLSRRGDTAITTVSSALVRNSSSTTTNAEQQAALQPAAPPPLGRLSHTMKDLQPLLERLASGAPFAYAHFNDGELQALQRTKGRTDRGLQRLSASLQARVRRALRTDAPNLVIGVPCSRNFPFSHALAMAQLANATATRLTVATLFINRNYEAARALLPRLVRARVACGAARLHLVVSEAADMARFGRCTGLAPHRVLRVPATDSYPAGFDAHADAWRGVEPGDVVLLCAGPLGRLLAVRWFARQPHATYLELGSFFDPELQPNGATLGPRYYPQTQCGVELDRSVYSPHGWYRGCEARGDTHATIDEGAVWAQAGACGQRTA